MAANTSATTLIATKIYRFAENQDSEVETPALKNGSVSFEVSATSLSVEAATSCFTVNRPGEIAAAPTTWAAGCIRSWLTTRSATAFSAEVGARATAAALGPLTAG